MKEKGRETARSDQRMSRHRLGKRIAPASNASIRVAGFLLVLAWIALPEGRADSDPASDAQAALRPLQKADTPDPPIGKKYQPTEGETIVLLGGTNVVAQQFANHFETMATLAWKDKDLRFRNLAWEADTVYRQQRPIYFFDRERWDDRAGSTPDQRQLVDAGTVMICFGKMESLDGLAKIDQFRDTYGRFLDALRELTPRVIVVTPTPFFLSGPAAALTRKRNEVLDVYTHAIRVTADERSLLVVDLFREIPAHGELSDNGVHLNDAGHRRVATALMRALKGEVPSETVATPELERLRERIAYKNSIWLQYFRPTNWAFLYGDRQHVPSSRDHMDSEKRWFPFEVERALDLVEVEESEIFKIANSMGARK